jgi:hypothetical protein
LLHEDDLPQVAVSFKELEMADFLH